MNFVWVVLVIVKRVTLLVARMTLVRGRLPKAIGQTRGGKPCSGNQPTRFVDDSIRYGRPSCPSRRSSIRFESDETTLMAGGRSGSMIRRATWLVVAPPAFVTTTE